jgi:hypothetical protein
VAEIYPGAVIEPLSTPARREPTAAEAAELSALVRAVAAVGEWSAAEIEEAITLAQADPEAALICWRTLAAEHGLEPASHDDRRTCEQCTNLDRHRGRDGFRRCAAARRGDLPHVASRDYSPVPDVPKRCEGFTAKPDDPDQRSGCERWPGLIAKDPTHD